MDILKIGADMLSQKLGTSAGSESIMSALSGLLGDGKGGVDLGGLAHQMMSSGELGDLVGSWLGDGANKSISAASILSLFGENKIGEFASKVGVDTSAAAGALSEVIPSMMDQSSSGGSLLDSLGGSEGLMGLAKKFF